VPCRYYFRVLERQTGSAKFGSYAAVVTGMSCALQLLLGSLLQVKIGWAPGPLPLVFASFIPFLADIPATSDFTLLGYKMTDKVCVGSELPCGYGRGSVAAGHDRTGKWTDTPGPGGWQRLVQRKQRAAACSPARLNPPPLKSVLGDLRSWGLLLEAPLCVCASDECLAEAGTTSM
jgi:hypothetical protein